MSYDDSGDSRHAQVRLERAEREHYEADECVPAREPGGVGKAMSDAEKALAIVHETVRGLRSRLKPVINEGALRAADKCAPSEPTGSPVAMMFTQLADMARRIGDDVSDLIATLDL